MRRWVCCCWSTRKQRELQDSQLISGFDPKSSNKFFGRKFGSMDDVESGMPTPGMPLMQLECGSVCCCS